MRQRSTSYIDPDVFAQSGTASFLIINKITFPFTYHDKLTRIGKLQCTPRPSAGEDVQHKHDENR